MNRNEQKLTEINKWFLEQPDRMRVYLECSHTFYGAQPSGPQQRTKVFGHFQHFSKLALLRPGTGALRLGETFERHTLRGPLIRLGFSQMMN
jgi:hypothetical protein